MRLLANDRSIVIKKADKGSCVVVWDREDYIAEANKQLNDENVYKSVKFKDKVLQDLADGIFKCLKQKGKITESNKENNTFLDLNVSLSGNKLTTDLHTKSTDKHQYLYYTSVHPAHTKRSIIYSQVLRMSRICSYKTDFEKHLVDMKSWFQ